jgi:hypothetical protein
MADISTNVAVLIAAVVDDLRKSDYGLFAAFA